MGGSQAGRRASDALGWMPVPCLALLLVAATHAVRELGGLGRVVLVFVIYLSAAPAIGWLTARWFGLRPAAGRTLIFSLGTRNSFVVLPLTLALPAGWELTVTIVVQPLTELMGMLVYLRAVSRWSPGDSG